MRKQAIIVVVLALVLFGVAVAGSLALIGDSDDTQPVHTLPGGQMHTGELEDATVTDEMEGTMPGMTHAG